MPARTRRRPSRRPRRPEGKPNASSRFSSAAAVALWPVGQFELEEFFGLLHALGVFRALVGDEGLTLLVRALQGVLEHGAAKVGALLRVLRMNRQDRVGQGP